MIVLGIETSCDETSAAVLNRDAPDASPVILSNIVATQIAMHVEYGGVVPELAARAHVESISAVIEKAVRDSGVQWAAIDGIAVANRPGLIGALLVGVSAAKALALALNRPLVGVDHIEAHLYSSILAGMPRQPHIALVCSGGHTSLYSVQLNDRQSATDMAVSLLGSTTDDAAGEAFDKVARILGLSYPGGPSIQKAAVGGDPAAYRFPRSRLNESNDDFSFSGLKTAVLYGLRGGQGRPGPAAQMGVGRELTDEEIRNAAASFQEAVAETLVKKTLRAAKRLGVSAASFNGGVAANKRIRELANELGAADGVQTYFPPLSLCTDNAAMIAGLGMEHLSAGRRDGLSLEAAP